MTRGRHRYRSRGSHEARPGPTDASLGVEPTPNYLEVRILSRYPSCLRFFAGLVFAFSSGLHLPLPTHTVDQPTTTSPSSITLSHAPPFALADSPPPPPSTALPNPPKQDIHPLHTSRIQSPAVASIRGRRTHPRFARVTSDRQARLWSCKLALEPK